MPKITINAKMIGIEEPIEVFTSIHNHDLASKMKIKFHQTDIKNIKYNLDLAKRKKEQEETDKNDTELSEVELLEQQLKDAEKEVEEEQENQEFVKESFDFIKEVLGLSAKQLKTAQKSVDESGLGAFVYYLILRLNNVPDFDPSLALDDEEEEEDEEDPKKD